MGPGEEPFMNYFRLYKSFVEPVVIINVLQVRIIGIFILLGLPLFPFAQLCTGSLGDPVVNIHFGSPGQPDISFTPPGAYTYISSTCPNDGYYSVVGSTQDCFGGTWHTVTSDHTGGGAFMLVNASYDPGDFFRTTVSELCPNTTYEFAAWVMNVLRNGGIRPDLTFRVELQDGTVLGTFSTGPIDASPVPQWRQYGFFFTTPAFSENMILRITNNAPGGVGNDLALDDITFRPCGPAVTATIQGYAGDIELCEKDTSRFHFLADPSSYFINPAIQWQLSTDSGAQWKDIPGAQAALFTRRPTGHGHYRYRFAVTETDAPIRCRINSNEIIVHVWPLPVADAGPDRVLIAGDSLTIQAVSETGSGIQWQPAVYLSDPGILKPVARPPASITYQLSVLSSEGCRNTDQVTINVVNGIYVPTAFTPNNDGRNDRWRIPYLDPEWGATVTVYDRYGGLVYRGEGPNMAWDGKRGGVWQSAGVYVYVLYVRSTGYTQKGTIMLIR